MVYDTIIEVSQSCRLSCSFHFISLNQDGLRGIHWATNYVFHRIKLHTTFPIRTSVFGSVRDNIIVGSFLSATIEADDGARPQPVRMRSSLTQACWSWECLSSRVGTAVGVWCYVLPHTLCSTFGPPSVQSCCQWIWAFVAQQEQKIVTTTATHQLDWWVRSGGGQWRIVVRWRPE